MTTVAVIGGGAAGMAAAKVLLEAGETVLLVEGAPRLGGNCHGVRVPDGRGGTVVVDAGVSDFNRRTFVHFAAFVDELGLPTRPIGTDASFATPDGRTLACCRDGRWTLDAELGDAGTFAAAVERFRRRAGETLRDPRFAAWTLGRYLDHVGASRTFRDVWALARAAGCFPAPDVDPAALPVRELAAFWAVHGVLGDRAPDRHTVVGGMHRWPAAFADWFTARGGTLLCSTRVLGIARGRTATTVRVVGRGDRHRTLRVDHVVLALHPHEALPLLESPTAAEAAALSRVSSQRARVVVHGDDRLVAADPAARSAFHYVVAAGGAPLVRPTITFHPNRLAGLGDAVPPVFVTVNPHVEPRADLVFAERHFLHPVLDVGGDAARAAVEALQGTRRTFHAGSWLLPPFVHESAFVSGMRAASRLVRGERAAAAAHAFAPEPAVAR